MIQPRQNLDFDVRHAREPFTPCGNVGRADLIVARPASSVVAFLSGERGADVSAVEAALALRQAALPPVVVTELLSDPATTAELAPLIRAVPSFETLDGYWERAGALRARLLRRGLRARLADALIAQSCLDHQVALVTRDRDFRNFTRYGLRLA